MSRQGIRKTRHLKAKRRTLDPGQGAAKRKPHASHRHHSLRHLRSLKGR